MKIQRILITTVFLFTLSCVREKLSIREESFVHCKENMLLECKINNQDSIYFKGKINGKPFCISSPSYGYQAYHSVGSIFLTSTNAPVLNPSTAKPIETYYSFSISPPIINQYNGIQEDFWPEVTIRTPAIKDSVVYPAFKYFDKFIRMGDQPLRGRWESSDSGFYFAISWSCVMNPGLNYYIKHSPFRIPVVSPGISPVFGPRGRYKFKISEVEKEETALTITYHITFEVSCDLFYGGNSAYVEYFGRLEDGIFKTTATIYK